MERTYKVTTTKRTHTIKATCAQRAANYVYSIMGEHDEIISVIRMAENGKEISCTWRVIA